MFTMKQPFRTANFWVAMALMAVVLAAVFAAPQGARSGDLSEDTAPEVTGSDFTPQPVTTFNEAGTYNLAMASLNTYEFVTAFADGSNSLYGTARFARVNGGVPEYGPKAVFNEGASSYMSIIVLNVGQIVVAYRDTSDSLRGKAVVGNISGNTITFGPEYTFNDGATFHISGDKVGQDSTTEPDTFTFVIAYQDGGDSSQGTAIVGTVEEDGTAITFGSEYDFNPATTGDLAMTAFPWQPNRFVIAFRDNADGNKGKAIHGTVGGNGYLITFGNEYFFNGDTSDITIDRLDTYSKFVVAYRDRANSDHGTAIIGDASPSLISFGSEYVFNSAFTTMARNLGVAWFGTDRFIVGYENADNNDGRVRVGDVEGTTINFGSPASMLSGANSSTVVVKRLAGEMFVAAWVDESEGNYGKARVYGGGVCYLPLILK